MQCNAIQCNAIQYNTTQYNAMQLNAIQYNTLYYNCHMLECENAKTRRDDKARLCRPFVFSLFRIFEATKRKYDRRAKIRHVRVSVFHAHGYINLKITKCYRYWHVCTISLLFPFLFESIKYRELREAQYNTIWSKYNIPIEFFLWIWIGLLLLISCNMGKMADRMTIMRALF
jgi:hypothetical protein